MYVGPIMGMLRPLANLNHFWTNVVVEAVDLELAPVHHCSSTVPCYVDLAACDGDPEPSSFVDLDSPAPICIVEGACSSAVVNAGDDLAELLADSYGDSATINHWELAG